MRFDSRAHAARELAQRLDHYRGRHPLVLGVPRGAVPMAALIADRLGGDVDVVLVKKLRAPGQRELAIGAVDELGTVVEGDYFDTAPPAYVREEIRVQTDALRTRRALYARAHAPVDAKGRVVILVDDGVATGASMLAAIRAVRARKPTRVVVAIGVAPPSSVEALQREADEVVSLVAPHSFQAVGQFYADFSEVGDEAVVAALSGAAPSGAAPPGTPNPVNY